MRIGRGKAIELLAEGFTKGLLNYASSLNMEDNDPASSLNLENDDPAWETRMESFFQSADLDAADDSVPNDINQYCRHFADSLALGIADVDHFNRDELFNMGYNLAIYAVGSGAFLSEQGIQRHFPHVTSDMVPVLNRAAEKLPSISIAIDTSSETWSWFIKQEDREPVFGEPFEISDKVRKEYRLSPTSFRDFMEQELLECEDNKANAINSVINDLDDMSEACRTAERRSSAHHSFNAAQVAALTTYLDGVGSGALYHSTRRQCLADLNKFGDRLLRTVVASLDDANERKATIPEMFDNADSELHSMFDYVQEQAYQKEKASRESMGGPK